MKKLLILFTLSLFFFTCKKEEVKHQIEVVEVEEISVVEGFANEIINNTLFASQTVQTVSEYAVELIITKIMTGSASVTPRSSCQSTMVSGNTVTTCHTGSCEVNGTVYTGCFVCVFDDITDPNSDIEITFDDEYSINGKDVDGVMNLMYVSSSGTCTTYNSDLLINTLDGAYSYNFSQTALTELTYCNGGDLTTANDSIFLSPSPTVTNNLTGESCLTQTTTPLLIDFNCDNTFPTQGFTEIQQLNNFHQRVTVGTVDFSYTNPCDSLAEFVDLIKNESVIINLSE